MTAWNTLDKATLESKRADLQAQYDAFKARNLSLDMTRGKPCAEQLDLANELISCLKADEFKDDAGTDCRNYGGLDGLPAMKAIAADFLEVAPDEVIIGGNSSLQLMHTTVMHALSHGVEGSAKPWAKLPTVKFLCPSPGYDRHFSICEHFGIEMITVNMTPTGPDMDQVEKLVAEDDAIKGIWIVPKYGNPTGITCSDETVDRLAKMKTAAADFRIFWDNAYTVHHLNDTPDSLKDILAACKQAGCPDRVFLFGSTSKVSFSGAGVAMIGGSVANMDWMRKHLFFITIGPDKLNQLRHVRFFKNMDGINAHMKKHAAIIKPKFDAVLEILESELGGAEIASWNAPNGGYFVSLDTLDGCAKDVVAMAADAGVKLTGAGATFPYKKDPRNSNIRIAPTLPKLDEIRTAMELVAVCIQLVSIDKLLG